MSDDRCPTLAVKDITPQEAWSGVKPSVAHFRVWGCIAHVHILKTKRGKLDDKSLPCILLGISEESKSYRLFDPNTKRIVVSKDVIFEEDKQWEWSKNYEEQIQSELVWGDDEGFSDEKNDGENKGGVNGDNGVDNNVGSGGEENYENEDSEVRRSAKGSFMDTLARERVRKTSVLLRDYVSGEGLSENERVVYIVQDGDEEDPTMFEDAVTEEKWRQTMDNEIHSIEKNKTWVLTDLPSGAKKVGVKWIYKTNEMSMVK